MCTIHTVLKYMKDFDDWRFVQSLRWLHWSQVSKQSRKALQSFATVQKNLTCGLRIFCVGVSRSFSIVKPKPNSFTWMKDSWSVTSEITWMDMNFWIQHFIGFWWHGSARLPLWEVAEPRVFKLEPCDCKSKPCNFKLEPCNFKLKPRDLKSEPRDFK